MAGAHFFASPGLSDHRRKIKTLQRYKSSRSLVRSHAQSLPHFTVSVNLSNQSYAGVEIYCCEIYKHTGG